LATRHSSWSSALQTLHLQAAPQFFRGYGGRTRPFLLQKSEGGNPPEEEPMKNRNRQPRTHLRSIAAADLAQVTGGSIVEYPIVPIVIGLLCLVSSSGSR